MDVYSVCALWVCPMDVLGCVLWVGGVVDYPGRISERDRVLFTSRVRANA